MAVIETRRLEEPRPSQRIENAPTSAAGLRHLADFDLLVLTSQRALHAFEVIYDRHIEAAWRVALVYTADVPAAERAVAAAFLHVWRHPEPESRPSFAARLLSRVKREAALA